MAVEHLDDSFYPEAWVVGWMGDGKPNNVVDLIDVGRYEER